MANKGKKKSLKTAVAPFVGLRMTIQGLALIYKPDDVAIEDGTRVPQPFKIECPFEKEHQLLLRIDYKVRESGKLVIRTTIFALPKGSVVTITHTDSIPYNILNLVRLKPAPNPNNEVEGKVLEINAIHGVSSPGDRIKLIQTGLRDKSSVISIPNVRLFPSVDPKQKNTYDKWDIQRTANPPRPRGKKEVKGEEHDVISFVNGEVQFNNPATAETRINVSNYSAGQININAIDIVLKYNLGANDIHISNMCDAGDQCAIRSDFIEYYEILDLSNMPVGQRRNYDFTVTDSMGYRAPCNVAYSQYDLE